MIMIGILGIVSCMIILYVIVSQNRYFHCLYCHRTWKPHFFQVIGNVNRQDQDYHVQWPYCHQVQNIKLSKKK